MSTGATAAVAPAVVICDGWLAPDLRTALFDRIVEREADFEWGLTRRGLSPHRRAQVLGSPKLGDLESVVLEHLCVAIEDASAQVGVDGSKLETIQFAVAASSSGCYYRPHRDRSEIGELSTRKVSAVTFLHDQPRVFTGGDLRLYGPTDDDVTVIDPLDNRLVVFPSDTLHEVAEVEVPTRQFRHGRFSLIAWAG